MMIPGSDRMSEKYASYDHGANENLGVVRDGTAGVSNGQIVVKNPQGSGKAATIIFNKDIKLFINDKPLKGQAVVTEDSIIKVEIDSIGPKRAFTVEVGDNNFKASAIVKYSQGETFALKDKSPENELAIEAVPSEKIPFFHFTMDEAMSILKDNGIEYGIMKGNLLKAISGEQEGPVIVAMGLEPIDGTDDTISIKFDNSKKFIEINDRVDFYSIGKVASVEAGQLLAEKIPGNEGKAGMDVYGKSIASKSGKKVNLKGGKGASLAEDGMKVYAGILGRPEMKNGAISVHQVYEVASDVDVSTGNIEFVGDVIIRGNIAEGMKVKAGNSVVLFGSVSGGEITSGGDVTIHKNVISSKVKAGCSDFIKYSIIDNLVAIRGKLESMFSAANILKETGKIPKIYKDGQIIKLLMDTKFNDLTHDIMELRNILADNKECLSMETLRLGAKLVKYYGGNGPLLIENYTSLKTYAGDIDSHIEFLKGQLKQPSDIKASYVQNSSLSTSGSIKIEGKGCYTSDLYCKGEIVIDKFKSVTRGGTINAGGEVKIYELGSPSGAVTTVCAPKDFTINCEIAHINCIIKIGGMASKLESTAKKLKAYLYKGELMIEKSKL